MACLSERVMRLVHHEFGGVLLFGVLVFHWHPMEIGELVL